MRLSRIDWVLDSVRALSGTVRVQGAAGASSAWVIHRLAREIPKPRWVVCADDEVASRLFEDLRAFSEAIDPSSVRAVRVPEWDPSLFQSLVPSLRTKNERLSALEAVGEAKPSDPLLAIGSLPALLHSTLAPNVRSARRFVLRKGARVESRELLLRSLSELGYARVDPVEEAGGFSVRGDLLDLYPPHLEAPVRIEWFDTEIERIRSFDPETQRTLDRDASEVIVTPAREILSDPETIQRLRRAVKGIADDQGIPKRDRDPLLESMREGWALPARSEIWTSIASDSLSSFLDYGRDWEVIWIDEDASWKHLDQAIEEGERLRKHAIEAGFPAPDVSQVWLKPSDLSARARMAFDPVDWRAPDLREEQDLEEEVGVPKPKLSHRIDASKTKLPPPSDLEGIRARLGEWIRTGARVVVTAPTSTELDRAKWLLRPEEPEFRVATVSEGFHSVREGLFLLPESDLLGKSARGRPAKKSASSKGASTGQDWAGVQVLGEIREGERVLHRDHGLGCYRGLVRIGVGEAENDFLHLEYLGGDKLYLPVYRLDSLQKHAGPSEEAPLDKLGGDRFQKQKDRAKESAKKLAIDLVELYAKRSLQVGEKLPARGDPLYDRFEAEFPFEETEDQLKAVNDCLRDLESGHVMDRLVCGDVGYGKTEVAMRAAFAATLNGKQVAVLVPTTVLAQQHENSFRNRFRDFPLVIDSVSRFKSPGSQKEVLKNLSEGKVDIIVGTHRLLSRDVRFKDLGLLIVDEEHRFGVEHKEKLKELRVATHVLTLTATPIPRTLQFSLSGIRDISLIATPPVDRLPIRTYLAEMDDEVISKALSHEFSRGGQAFVVHNRVQTIHTIAERVHRLAPTARIGVAHGQMPESELERAMLAFYRKETDVLVCTTIVESGLDVPNANTIVIDRADAMGLAQLYQLRGRVGRSDRRAYAYLLVPSGRVLTEDAKKRLDVIQRFVELGSGFQIANHDLEIRGGGNLLGAEQSGHIEAVGFDLYLEMLEDSVRELRGKPDPDGPRVEPEIKVPFPSFLPDAYVPDPGQRLMLYRKLSASKDEQSLSSLREELRDRFGPPPLETENLLGVIRLKQLLRAYGVESLTLGNRRLTLVAGALSRLDPAKALLKMRNMPEELSLTPDSRIVLPYRRESLGDLSFRLEALFGELASSIH